MKHSQKLTAALAVAVLTSILWSRAAFAVDLPSELAMAYAVNFTACEGEETSCGTTVMGFDEIKIPLKIDGEGRARGAFKTSPTQMKDATVVYDINAHVIRYGNGYMSKTLSIVQTITSKNGQIERSVVGATTFENKVDGVLQFHGRGFKTTHRGQTQTTFATLEIAGR